MKTPTKAVFFKSQSGGITTAGIKCSFENSAWFLFGYFIGTFYKHSCTFTFIHLADAFIQNDLQLLYMSEVARL